MTAPTSRPGPEILDLRRFSPGDLDPILEEEQREWQRELDWDFGPSADLVRRFVGMQALNGYVIVADGRPAGYSYFVSEERKGLIGDLYVLAGCGAPEQEAMLLSATFHGLAATPGVRRIESQLMLLRRPGPRPLPGAGRAEIYERQFMTARLAGLKLPPSRLKGGVCFETWSERRQDDAAQTIASAYKGHVDARINDQYRSAAGSRRFLSNIVQYPGCGRFFQPGSWLALDGSARVCGVSLCSLVASTTGHITQICVTPAWQGAGVGYELMRRSLQSLGEHGCDRVSLTVTASNSKAIGLYERIGFETRRRFSAYVWDDL